MGVDRDADGEVVSMAMVVSMVMVAITTVMM